jgi:methionine-rich copper-binding protein CopC
MSLLLATASPASAHDVLESTTPGDGATVPVTPAQVTLTFDQPAFAIGSQVLVDGPDGNVAQGPVKIVDRVVTQAVRPGAPAGSYTVEWRVTSADGHPVTGKFAFTSAAASAGSAGPATSSSSGAAAGSAGASSSSGSGSAWLLPVLALVAVWVVVAVFAVRHKQRSITPTVDKRKERNERRRRGFTGR